MPCNRELRKTFESLQAWRRTHGGAYPGRLADLKRDGLVPNAGAICPEVHEEAEGAESSHHLATSRIEGGDPSGTYEYELSDKVAKSKFDSRWLPAGGSTYTRLHLKAELLRRSFFEQVPILRCTSHRALAPPEFTTNDSPWRNFTVEGKVYWSGEFWEQVWLADVPYCCRDANVLFGLKGPPFHSGRAPTLPAMLDLRPWICAFGDHSWWWTYPMFEENANKQTAAHLRPFFIEQHGRAAEISGNQWWIDGLVQVQGKILRDAQALYRGPTRQTFVWERKGLNVARSFQHATWLQGTVWTASAGETAGWLVWHYADSTIERVPLVYGQTTARFWGDAKQIKAETNSPKPVWEHHETAEAVGKERWLRLYQQTWTNPHPNVVVTSLDFVSNSNCPAAPFLIAVNVVP